MRSLIVAQQVRRQVHAAVAAHGQLVAILQLNGNGTGRTSLQLLTGKYTVTFDQRASRTIAGHRENLTDHFADDADQTSHVYPLCCRPLSAPVFTGNMQV